MKTRSLSYQKSQTWKAFSVFIRLRDADGKGIVKCCTCPRIVFWKDGSRINAGHAVSGRGNAVLFDETLVAGQCTVCNHQGAGEQYKFFENLKNKYGWDDGVIQEKLNMRHQTKKYTVSELRELELFYIKESRKIAKEKGLSLT